MIPSFEINQFLKKPVEDHTWVKSLDETTLDQELSQLIPRPNLSTDFSKRQKACFLLGVAYPQFFFLCDMGFGKTLLSLELLRYYIRLRKIRKWAVILVPTDELIYSWEDEIKKWTPDLPYCLLVGSSSDKWSVLEEFQCGLVIGTYLGVSAMLSELRQIRGKKSRKRRPVVELMNRFRQHIDALIIDQSSKVGDVTSLSYEITRDLSQHAKIRYALAGRPFGRDPIKLWSQCYLIDRGITLTSNYNFFRGVFFDKKKAFWGGPNTYEYKFRKELESDLSRLLGNRSIRYSSAECSDLPALTTVVKKVSFPEDMSMYYQRVLDEMLVGGRSYQEIEGSFVKMRQICSGFLSFVDSAGEKVHIDFKSNPKMDELFELIDEMPEDSKAIIFYEFTHSAKKLSDELKRRKIKHGWLWAGTKTWPAMKQSFDTDPEFRVLINQWRKGGMGLNLQAADYMIYYESPTSALDRDESNRRNYRQGQSKHVFRYDIVVRDSVEEQILAFHRQGDDLFKALVRDPKILRVA